MRHRTLEAVAHLAVERQPGAQRDRLVLRSGAQMRVDAQHLAVGVDDLAGVHAVLRVPQRLELAESLHELGAVHPFQ